MIILPLYWVPLLCTNCEGAWLSNIRWVIVADPQQILAELVEGDFLEQRLSKPLLSWWREVQGWRQPSPADCVEGGLNQISTSCVSQAQSRATAESSDYLLNIEVEPSASRAVRGWLCGFRRTVAVHLIVQHSTNRADSLRESLYLVQYLIVRIYEIPPPLGDTASESP